MTIITKVDPRSLRIIITMTIEETEDIETIKVNTKATKTRTTTKVTRVVIRVKAKDINKITKDNTRAKKEITKICMIGKIKCGAITTKDFRTIVISEGHQVTSLDKRGTLLSRGVVMAQRKKRSPKR